VRAKYQSLYVRGIGGSSIDEVNVFHFYCIVFIQMVPFPITAKSQSVQKIISSRSIQVKCVENTKMCLLIATLVLGCASVEMGIVTLHLAA
jgi:hypothetical protein